MKRIKFTFFSVLALLLSIFILSHVSVQENEPYSFPNVKHFPKMPINPNNEVTIDGINLGRYLFYDPILSSDSTIACSNCHSQKYAFSDSPNKFSKGISQQTQQRNTLALFNLAWYPKLFWDGRVNSIEGQVFHPVRTASEMNANWLDITKKIKRSSFYPKMFLKAFGTNEIDSQLISKAIAQFERTLISYNSKYDKVIRNEAKFTIEELEGLELINDFTKGACSHCHPTDAHGLGTTGDFSNNGLDDEFNPLKYKDFGLGKTTQNISDNGRFKIPSLRNLAFTAPYMHDGRFNTLEEVLDFYSENIKESINIDSKMVFVHQGGAKLNKYEKKKIIAFLNTLNDSVFISDKKFGNPFNKSK